MHVAVIAQPGDRRAELARQALEAAGASVDIVPWTEVAARTIDPARFRSASVIRVDSTGESVDALNAVRLVGGAPEEIRSDPSRIGWSRAWYIGVVTLVDEIAHTAPEIPIVPHPSVIRLLCDKAATHQVLERAGVPVPPSLGTIGSYADLLERCGPRGGRVMVKPRHGSASVGNVAVILGSDRVEAWCAAEPGGDSPAPRYRSSLQLRRYAGSEVADLIDHLGPEGLHVERWFPKIGTGRGPVDVRVVVTDGRASHRVVRQGRGPFTNLHLGGGRVPAHRMPPGLGPEVMARVDLVAEAAYRAVTDSVDGAGKVAQMGVDVLVSTGGRIAVCEVNAFGDLLPGILDDLGRSTYEAQASSLVSCSSQRPVLS